MMLREGKSVSDWFRTQVRDCTPSPTPDSVTVVYAPFSLDKEITRLCATVLSAHERLRADRFINEVGKSRFIQRRAFRRYCALLADSSQKDLSQVDFRETVNGRPYLSDREDIWFSFSACSSGCLGAWSMSHAVGIDIEAHMQNIEAVELAKTYFSEPEAMAVATLEDGRAVPTFLKYWSLKEAALKSIGEGLPFGLDTFEFRLDPQVSVAKAPGEPSSFTAFAVSAPNSVAALVIRDITYELSLTQQLVGIQALEAFDPSQIT